MKMLQSCSWKPIQYLKQYGFVSLWPNIGANSLPGQALYFRIPP